MKSRKLIEMTLGILTVFSLISSPILATVSASEINNKIYLDDTAETSLIELLNIESKEDNESLRTYLSKIKMEANELGHIILEEEKNSNFSLEINEEELATPVINIENKYNLFVLKNNMDKTIEIEIKNNQVDDSNYIYIHSFDFSTGKIDVQFSKDKLDIKLEEITQESNNDETEQDKQEFIEYQEDIENSKEDSEEDIKDSAEDIEDSEEQSDIPVLDEQPEDLDSSELDSSVDLDLEDTNKEDTEDKEIDSSVSVEESIEVEESVDKDDKVALEDKLEENDRPSVMSEKTKKVAVDSIQSSKTVSYYASVKGKNEGIYTTPKGTANSILVTSYLYNNNDVKVVQEATTKKGVFVKLLLVKENKVVGWINKKDLIIQTNVTSSKKVHYYASVNKKNSGIFTLPREIYGSKLLTSYLYNDFTFIITEEATTQNGTYAKLTNIGTNQVVGWIKSNELNKDSGIINRKNVEYYGRVNPKNNGIYTQPKSLKGSVLVTSYLFNSVDVKVTEEMQTSNGTFLKLNNIKNGQTIGWLNKTDLIMHPGIGQVTTADYYATVKTGNKGIYTLPKGIFGSTLLTSYLYNNQEFAATEETKTSEGIYVKLVNKSTGKEVGWINKADITVKEYITSIRQVNYDAIVLKNNGGIYTRPKGAFNSLLLTSYIYNGQKFRVVEEAITPNGTYLKLTDVNSKKEIGWIIKDGVTVTENNFKKYNAIVRSGNDGIYTLPKSIQGSVLITSYLYNGQRFEVTEEYVTSTDTYAKLTHLETGAFIGWINKKWTNSQNTVFLDPGHGGTETGAYYYGVSEKTINLEVSKKVQALLESRGYNVIIARTSDIYIDFVTKRSEMANATNADIFVSIHHNAMPNNTTAHGIETYYYKYDPNYPSKINGAMHNDPDRVLQSAKLAKSIHGSLIDGTGAYDRGVRTESFAVLRETAIPAVLLELGYMSSPNEIKRLTSASYQNTLATSIVNGIDQYFN